MVEMSVRPWWLRRETEEVGRIVDEWGERWRRRERWRNSGWGGATRRPRGTGGGRTRSTRPEGFPMKGEVVGRTTVMRRLWWTAREERRGAVVVGTETNSGEVTGIRGRNDDGELLGWAKEAGEE